MSTRSVSRRPNGHDTAQRRVDNAAEPRCPYCGQEIVGGQDQADEILARIENTERARLARLETGLKLRVPVDRDHGFRRKVITQSGGT